MSPTKMKSREIKMGMRKNALLALLGLGALGATTGCGQVSYFEVSVSLTGLTPSCSYAIASCEVTVSGAATDFFNLTSKVCDAQMTLNRGTFQYGTEAESGNVNFHLEIFNGNRDKLGMGDASKAIQPGGRAKVDLMAAADPAALTATHACAQ
jgi:hypothetical protein